MYGVLICLERVTLCIRSLTTRREQIQCGLKHVTTGANRYGEHSARGRSLPNLGARLAVARRVWMKRRKAS